MILWFFSLVVFSVINRKSTVQMVNSSIIEWRLSCHKVSGRFDFSHWWFEALWENTLMHHLLINSSIFEKSLTSFLKLLLLKHFWSAQSGVKGILVFVDVVSFSIVASCPMILTLRKNIIFLLLRSCMRFSSFAVVVKSWVLAEVVVESSFETRWLINLFQPSSRIRDICIPTTTIVGIIHGFWVNMGQIISWSFLSYNKWTYIFKIVN